VKLWDAETGRELSTIGHTASVQSAAFSPDGRCIVSTVPIEYTMKVWDVETGRELHTLSGYTQFINSAAFSPDGRRIISASQDNTVKLWDVETGRELHTISGHSHSSGEFSPDGRWIVSAGGYDKIVKMWDADTGREICAFSGHSDYVNSAAFSPDGRRIISASWDGTVKVWDTPDQGSSMGKELRTLSGHTDKVNSAVSSPDGRRIVSASDDKTVKVWDAESGKELRTLSGHSERVRSAAFSPDGRRIVSASSDGTVKIWNADTGREFRTLQVDTDWVFSAMFSPNGRQIVSASEDMTVKVWDAETGRKIRTFFGHNGRVRSAVFSPDGRHIVSASNDGTTRLWDADTGEEIAQFVSFSGSDAQLASATRDIAVEEIAEKAASNDGEWLVITPDGYYNASPRGDRYINVRVGNTVSGIDSYRSVFYNPEVVNARLNNRPDPASKANLTIQQAASFAPPTVMVRTANSATTTGTADISVTVSDRNQPVKNIKVLVNGTLLGRDDLLKASGRGLIPEKTSRTVTGDLKEVSFTLPVPLEPGENTIEVAAFNGYTDNRRSATVTWQTTRRLPPPNLWILAIGVNQYDDPRIRSLNYCVSDAQGIIEAFKSQEGKRYGKVNSLLIADGAAVTPAAANIRNNLKWLDQAGPRDVIVLFLAGHGVTSGNSFYFVPRDAALGTGNSLDPSKAIADTDLLSALDGPGKRLIFIDACQSGGVDGNLMTRVLMESNGLVFTASLGNERSSEFEDLRHGIFTYSIMQGLSGRYNTRGERDIRIQPLSVSVSDFVSSEVERRTRDTGDPRSQHPKVYSLGFPELTIAVTE
jgi:WD40 repeat protein